MSWLSLSQVRKQGSRKEVAAHLLAYNLIRFAMGETARPEGLEIRQLGFATARRAAAMYQSNVRQNATRRTELQRAASCSGR